MSLRTSWDIPAPQSEDEARENEGGRSDRVDAKPGQDSGTAARGPHWRDFARGEAKDFMWSEDANMAEAAGGNEVHALRLRIEDIADQLAGIARQQSATAIARAPSPTPRPSGPAPASAPRADFGQIEVIERTIHDIIRHLEASDRHHAEALRQMQGDIQMLLDRGEGEPADGARPDMAAAFARIEERIQALAARIEAAEKPEHGADMSLIESRLASLAESIEKLARSDDNRQAKDTISVGAPAEDAADTIDADTIDETGATASAEAAAEIGEIMAAEDPARAETFDMEGDLAWSEDEDGDAIDLVFEAISDSALAAEKEPPTSTSETAEDFAAGSLYGDVADNSTGSGDAEIDLAGAKERLSDFMRRQERRRERLNTEAGIRGGTESQDKAESLESEPGIAPAGEENIPEEKALPEVAAAPDAATDLPGKLERRVDMLDERLAERFAELSTRLQSSLREAGDTNTLSALKEQVGDMAARLDELAARPRADDGEGELKSQISDLADRLVAAEARFASLDTLEYTLTELTGRLDKAEESLRQSASAGRADARELDRQFAALFEQLEVSRESMLNAARLAATEIAETAAAESAKQVAEDAVRQAQRAAVTAACEAARQAVAETPSANGDNGEGKIISQLRDSLLELRAEIKSNDREGRAALDAVEDNLRALALRFDEWETREDTPAAHSEPRAESPRKMAEPLERAATGGLPDDLASLRLPPLEIGELSIADDGPEPDESVESRAMEGPRDKDAAKGDAGDQDTEPQTVRPLEDIIPEPFTGDPVDKADSPLPAGEEDMAPPRGEDGEPEADSLKRREPGSGPPSAIIDSLGLGLPTKFDKRDLPDPKASTAVKAEDIEDTESIPSLGGARTTNELLAAARRAAEAASNQAQSEEKENQSLRERLRIPLSRKDGKGKPAEVPAKEKAVKPAKAKTKAKAVAAKDGTGKPVVRKPILLATAAVILIAGSFEIYSMLKDKPGEVIDATPVVEPGLPASAPKTGDSDGAALPNGENEGSVLDDHLPMQGGTAEETAPASGEPAAMDPDHGNPAPGASEPARETTSSLSTDPRAEPNPRPQDEQAMAELPPLPEGIGPDALRQAAASGDPIARFEVASRLAEGRGVDPDTATAAKWYRLAAASGLAPAQYRLGSLYEKGTGVAKDRVTAGIWYRRAADQGNRKAMHNLAVLNADGIESQPDFATAARWFRAAAELGLNDSQYNLGILHVRGLGVPQNLAEAYKWFAILAAHGDDDAAQRRDAVASQMDASAVAAARLAAKTWKAKPLIAQANAVRLPQSGWAAPEPAGKPGLPGPEIIRAAQRLLSQGGYQPGPADGRWGPMTQTAIRSFQRDSGIETTGQLTPELLQKLHSRLAG